MDKPAGILYWSLQYPPYGKILADGDTHQLCINTKIRMLTELSAFLSRKNIYPEVYLVTGLYNSDVKDDFINSLKQTTMDSYLLDESGQIEPDELEKQDGWHIIWTPEDGLLIASRQPAVAGHYAVYDVAIMEDHLSGPFKAGVFFPVTLNLRYNRTLNILLYDNFIYSASYFANLTELPQAGDSLDAHPIIRGLQQGIRKAQATFGKDTPFLVATTLNLPVDQMEIRQYLDQELGVSLHFSQNPPTHSFNLETNQLARFWFDFYGGIDFADTEESATSALVDMIGLYKGSGQQALSVQMNAIPFRSVKSFKVSLPLEVPDGQLPGDNYVINKKMPAPCPECPTLDYSYDSILSPAGNEPVYAEVTFADRPDGKFPLPGVYAIQETFRGETSGYSCGIGVTRRIIDFVKHRQLPDTVLVPAIAPHGDVVGKVMKSRQDDKYSFTWWQNYIYLGILTKSPGGEVIGKFSKECQYGVMPETLCHIRTEILEKLIENANKEYDHGARAFLKQYEGKYLRYNLYYQY